MTQTTPSHGQAVEAAEHYTDGRRWSCISNAWILESSWNDREEIAYLNSRIENLRAAITSQQEVAAPVGGLEKYMQGNYPNAKGETLEARVIYALEEMDVALGMKSAEEYRAASRVPVASLASREQGVEAVGAVPVPKLEGSPFEKYTPQLLHAAFVDGWASCRDAEFSGNEAMNDSFNQSSTHRLCINIEHPSTAPAGTVPLSFQKQDQITFDNPSYPGWLASQQVKQDQGDLAVADSGGVQK